MGAHEASSVDPASFRDPDSTVLHAGTEVLRRLSPAASEDWRMLAKTTFFGDRVAKGDIVATAEVDENRHRQAS